jgi:hypothetical protein
MTSSPSQLQDAPWASKANHAVQKNSVRIGIVWVFKKVAPGGHFLGAKGLIVVERLQLLEKLKLPLFVEVDVRQFARRWRKNSLFITSHIDERRDRRVKMAGGRKQPWRHIQRLWTF